MTLCHFAFAVFLFLTSPSFAAEHPPIAFQAVNAQLYRGGRPSTMDSMSWVAHQGIHTIVNLQGKGWKILPGETQGQIADGRAMAESLGLRYFNYPVTPGGQLDDNGVKMLLEIVRVMSDPQLTPVYVHCNVGADRTGLVVAAYRIVHDGCSFDQANRELTSHGLVWTPALMGREIAFLRELAANPRKYGVPAPQARCTLP